MRLIFGAKLNSYELGFYATNWGSPIRNEWEIGIHLFKWHIGLELF